jgi:DNA-binding transcriptional LysR family regulator
MSQPPLSTQIRNLEEDLGVQLFIRGKRRLQLTEAGLLLQRQSRQILALAEKTRGDLTTLEHSLSGVLNIGIVEGRAPYLASRLIRGFREEYPLVRYHLWNGNSDGVLEQLDRGLVDVAIIARPYDRERLEGIPVGAEPWVAILSREHPLAKETEGTIPLERLVGEPLIVPSRRSRVEAIRRWFAGIGAEPLLLVETANYLDAVALAEQNVGISIFPQTSYAENPHTTTRVITDPVKIAEYVMVVEKGQRQTALVQEFLHFTEDFMQEGCMHSEKYHADAREREVLKDAELL